LNHLAHTFLSHHRSDILVVNTFTDLLTHSEIKLMEHQNPNGILIHKWIDAYTDQHPAVIGMVRTLREDLSKYAAIGLDIYFDYFLALKWSSFSETDYRGFCDASYHLMRETMHMLPERVHAPIHNMIENDWLASFATKEGLYITFEMLSKRVKFENNFLKAIEILDQRFFEMEAVFMEFFPELNAYVMLRMEELLPIA